MNILDRLCLCWLLTFACHCEVKVRMTRREYKYTATKSREPHLHNLTLAGSRSGQILQYLQQIYKTSAESLFKCSVIFIHLWFCLIYSFLSSPNLGGSDLAKQTFCNFAFIGAGFKVDFSTHVKMHYCSMCLSLTWIQTPQYINKCNHVHVWLFNAYVSMCAYVHPCISVRAWLSGVLHMRACAIHYHCFSE